MNIDPHFLVLDGVYRCGSDGVPVFVEAPTPTDVALQAVLCLVGKEEMRRRKAVAAPVSLRWQAHRPSDNGISSL